MCVCAGVCVISHFPVLHGSILTPVLASFSFVALWVGSVLPTLGFCYRRLPSNVAPSRASASCVVYFFHVRRKWMENK